MNLDIRDGLFNKLFLLTEQNEKIFFTTGDMGFLRWPEYHEKFPTRTMNIGIMEQQSISFCAGLAMQGYRPIFYTINNFASFRCLEQIRVDVCIPKLPVCIISVGPGYGYHPFGPTHHGTEDLAVIRAIPHMTIYHPSDCATAEFCLDAALKLDGPSYIRLEKGQFVDYPLEVENNGCRYVRFHVDAQLTFVTYGYMTHQCLKTADKMLEQHIKINVIDVFRPWPVPEQIVNLFRNPETNVLVVEEHSLVGGLASAIGEQLLQQRILPKKGVAALPHHFLDQTGSRDYLLREFGGLGIT